MSDFLDLIRSEHQRGQEVQKSKGSGRVIRPDDHFVKHPFAQTVLDGVRQRLVRQERPTHKGTKVLDRQPTFVDVVCGAAAGVDVVQKSPYDDWTTEDLSDVVDEFLDFLDST